MKRHILLVILIISLKFLSTASISGFITSKNSGEPLMYVSVVIEDTHMGAISNIKGYYVINNVTVGKYRLIASQIGYAPSVFNLEITSVLEEITLNLNLEKRSIETDGIKVVGKRFENEINAREIKVSNILRTTEDIRQVAKIVEPDVFRALQYQPGVTPISDFSSGLYVRGGSPDQNLILIDGIDVYNPTHFGGIFSTFNTDAVKNVELLKGGFPAEYGGRLSSVLNVTNKDGNRKKHEGVARISLLSSSATLEGPWKLGDLKGSYMVSGRRTYLELIKKGFALEIPDYYFYDGHAKLNIDLSQKDKLSFSTYLGKDRLIIDDGYDFFLSWGNETVSSQWTHIFNPQLFSHFIMAGSHFGSLTESESDADEYWKRANHIYDVSIKSFLSYQPEEAHIIDFGVDCKYNEITFETKTNSDIDDDHMPNVEVKSAILATYLQDSWNLNLFWTIEPGIRMTYNHSVSEYLSSKPDADYFRLSPRFAIRNKITEKSSIYASYGKYFQYLNLLSYGESSPMDLWFPLDKTVEPGSSDHYILGYKNELSGKFALDVETYYKDYNNLVEYRWETDYEWDNENGTLSDVLNLGIGHSYGCDILLRNDWKGFEGFIGYTYCYTRRKINNTNINPENGEEEYYFPKYDRTHQINIVETYNLAENTGKKPLGADWSIGLTLTYCTGQPYEKPEHAYFDGEYVKFIYSYRDRYRLPDYFRTDLSLNLKWDFRNWSLEPYIQVINLTAHDNVWDRSYTAPIDENGIITIDEHETTMFPFIPFIGVNAEW